MTDPALPAGCAPSDRAPSDQVPASAMHRPVVEMIATDIDGTMLRADGTLSPRVHAALHHAHAAGMHVVPATGRPMMVAEDVIEALGLNNYWVFANGAVTRHLDRDELVRAYWMDPTVAQGIVVEMRAAYPDCGFAIELEHGVAHEPGFIERVPQAPFVPAVPDVLDAMHGRVQKVLVFHPTMTMDELFVVAGEVVGDDAVPSYSGLGFIELAARLVTKASALDELCRDLGIDPAAVAAFGDNHNDVAMLEWAGRSYAMGNASNDAKVASDEVIATSEDDGLAVIVEQLIDERRAVAPTP